MNPAEMNDEELRAHLEKNHTKDQLQELCTKLGLEYDPRGKKADLVEALSSLDDAEKDDALVELLEEAFLNGGDDEADPDADPEVGDQVMLHLMFNGPRIGKESVKVTAKSDHIMNLEHLAGRTWELVPPLDPVKPRYPAWTAR